MPTPIRAQDTLRLTPPPPPAQATAAAKPQPRVFEDDTFFRTAPTPAQVEQMHRAVAALDALPSAPKGVLAQRAWVAQVAPVAKAADLAARGLGNAAFFHHVGSRGAADAASRKVDAFRDRMQTVEELAGLRKPQPPADPNRPRGQALNLTEKLLNDPVGAPLGAVVAPLALVFDGLDAVSRPAERAQYPAAVRAYEARLAAYEKARRDFPVP